MVATLVVSAYHQADGERYYMFDTGSIRSKRQSGFCLKVRMKRSPCQYLSNELQIDRSALRGICENNQECIGVLYVK
jgi:hypothetical protein